MNLTHAHLADGRDIFFFDDEPRERTVEDPREITRPEGGNEMRFDPFLQEWVAIAAARQNRTHLPSSDQCPLCPSTQERSSEIPQAQYDVAVFENRFPSFRGDEPVPADLLSTSDAEQEAAGLVQPGSGRCEVVCFTDEHTSQLAEASTTRMRTVVDAWAARSEALLQMPGVEQVYCFENRGEEIGVTLQHPHGQIYSYPYLPPRIRSVLSNARDHQERTGRDLFEDVLAAEQRSGERIVLGTDLFTLFVPAGAKWPLEVMLIPNRPVGDFTDLTDFERAELPVLLKALFTAVDRFFDGVEKTPYIAGWNQMPVQSRLTGEDESLRGEGRLHLQVFSLMRSPNRMKFLAGSESAFGAWISDTTPETIAQRMREIWPESTEADD